MKLAVAIALCWLAATPILYALAADSVEQSRACAEWSPISSPWPARACFRFSQTGAVVCEAADLQTFECKEP